MRKVTRLLLIAAISASTLLMGGGTALACSCFPPDPMSLIEGTDGAFVGTLIDQPDEELGPLSSSGEIVPRVFRVEAAYKGEIVDPMTVYSPISGATCGLEMAEGSTASLFIDEVDGQWHGSLCQTMGPEALLESGLDEIAVGEADSGGSTTVARWVLAGMIGVGLAGGLVLRRMRNEPQSSLPESQGE